MQSYFSYLRIIEDKIWRKIHYFYIRYFDIRYFVPSIFVFRHFFI